MVCSRSKFALLMKHILLLYHSLAAICDTIVLLPTSSVNTFSGSVVSAEVGSISNFGDFVFYKIRQWQCVYYAINGTLNFIFN